MTSYSVGIDIGGTFTDVVCTGSDGSFRLMKLPTTRADPAAAVRQAIEAMRDEWDVAPADIRRFVHGSTVATNAVIERKGARIGLITTAGFRDVLEIGRQMRHAMYDLVLSPETPVFLAPGARRKEVRERVSASGEEVVALGEDEVRARAAELVAEGCEAVAIVFLFSFLNPAHELRARDIIAEAFPDLMVSLSSEVDPAFREYERTASPPSTPTSSRSSAAIWRRWPGTSLRSGSRRHCKSCSRAAASPRPPPLAAARCGCSCPAPPPAWSAASRSPRRPGQWSLPAT